jgi:hypothetical protein
VVCGRPLGAAGSRRGGGRPLGAAGLEGVVAVLWGRPVSKGWWPSSGGGRSRDQVQSGWIWGGGGVHTRSPGVVRKEQGKEEGRK